MFSQTHRLVPIGFLLIAAFFVRAPFFLEAGNLMDLDEATFGLMARHILEGELPIYIWGHSYSGSLVSFAASPLFLLLGMKPLALKLAGFVFFSSFLALNFVLLEKLFSRRTSFLVSLLLIFMPPGVFDVSMRTWGSHAELWPFAAGLFLLLHFYFDTSLPEQRKPAILFLAGYLAGAGLWLSSLFLLFLIPLLIHFVLRSRPHGETVMAGLVRIIFLTNLRIPPWLRAGLLAFHGFVLFFLVMQCLAAGKELLGETALEPLIRIFGTDPPFRVKEMKRIAFILIGEAALLSFWVLPAWKDREQRLPRGLACNGRGRREFSSMAFQPFGG